MSPGHSVPRERPQQAVAMPSAADPRRDASGVSRRVCSEVVQTPRREARLQPCHLIIVHPLQVQLEIETSISFKPAVKAGLN